MTTSQVVRRTGAAAVIGLVVLAGAACQGPTGEHGDTKVVPSQAPSVPTTSTTTAAKGTGTSTTTAAADPGCDVMSPQVVVPLTEFKGRLCPGLTSHPVLKQAAKTATLNVAQGGKVTADFGCNTLAASATITAGTPPTMTVKDWQSTKKACDDATMAFDSAAGQNLVGPIPFSYNGVFLTLFPGTEKSVTFVKK